MKFEYGLILTVGILASVSLGLAVIQPGEIPHWEALQHIKQQQFEDGCNKECMIDQEKLGNFCTEVQKDEYVCRPPREIRFSDQELPTLTAFPPTYGEFAYFPDGLKTVKYRLFDIAKVDLINKETNEIQIEFGNHNLEDPDKDFQYSARLFPGQTFVSHCTGSDLKTGHLVEYLDVFELDGITYIEFWGSHVTIPDSLLPCDMPALIENSVHRDLSLGIDFNLN